MGAISNIVLKFKKKIKKKRIDSLVTAMAAIAGTNYFFLKQNGFPGLSSVLYIQAAISKFSQCCSDQ